MTVPFLDLSAPYGELKPEIDAAIGRVLKSGWYILGPEVDAFEAAWADWTGAAHAVGLANGLDALTLALRALDIGEGDEVIVPSNTYIASWLAVTAVGARPVAVEPDPATHNIDPERIEDAITPRTRAIMPVHLYGLPADMTAVLDVARRRGLAVVEDAAQAHGARYGGRRIGAHGDVVCWSFYPGKNLGAMGDGGAITTDDLKLADRVRVLRNYGSRVKYENLEIGVNSRLDPLQAAVLSAKLPKLEEWTERRRVVARAYLDGLRDTGLILPVEPAGSESAWHLFVVRTDRRDALQRALSEARIGTLIHYPIPPHRQQAYRSLAIAPDAFPIARELADQVLSLPIGPHLPPEAVERVIAAIRYEAGR
jgi:dTDP-4-amino-4,6-dideoxygalactose transaminase